MNEREALALIEKGTSVRDLVRDHGHELEVHISVGKIHGKDTVARAKVDIVESEEGELLKATAIVERDGRPVRFTVETAIDDAEDMLREAVEANYAQLAVAKVADFLSAKNGSRKVMFARRLTPPVSAAESEGSKYVPRRLSNGKMRVEDYRDRPHYAPSAQADLAAFVPDGMPVDD